MSFAPDSSRVDVVLAQPNHSGEVGKPCAFGLHDIECPPGDQYRSLAGPDYLQNPAEQHSVQYVRIGKWRAQGVPESEWAWGMGTPASKHTTHEEQAGYASFSRSQWLGTPDAVGTTYTRPNGLTVVFTAADAQFMADQFEGVAGDYADWCKRNGYTPKLGTMDELARTCNGEQLGILFTHAMASRLPNTTTVHTDPGPSYPLDRLIVRATQIFNGDTAPSKPSTPKDGFLMALSDAQQQRVFDFADTMLTNGTADGQRDVGSTFAAILDMEQKLYNQGNQIRGAVINAARKGGTPEQIADAVAAELGSK